MEIDLYNLPSPCFVLEEELLLKNLGLMKQVQQEAGVDIILALKGFAMWSTFPLIRNYLKGATASSLNEARLCVEEMGTLAHTYCVAYHPEEFQEILQLSSHITFNSLSEFHRYQPQLTTYKGAVSCGVRINPGYSDVETDLYNPAAPGSRLGETAAAFSGKIPQGIEGLHFHTLCESSSYSLEKLLYEVEKQFSDLIPHLKWVNMGGGHLMTRKDYDVQHLIRLLKDFQSRYQVEIILEPGSAVAWDTGFLVATVLDITNSQGITTAILDVSFTAHMPDTLEMPYRPRVRNAIDPEEGKPSYRLGGVSCLAGDYLTEYTFDEELAIGDRIIFEDMIHYTMVKTTMFNGVKHPSIAIARTDGHIDVVRTFNYEDYKNRLS